ncbi:MAG: hypothetical protein ABIA04_07755 [Pseudomonadota bacterium]
MKNIIIYIFIILFLTAFQASFLNELLSDLFSQLGYFNFVDVKINILILIILYFGVVTSLNAGFLLSVFAGICFDLLCPSMYGTFLFIYPALFLLLYWITDKFHFTQLIPVIILMILVTVFEEIILFILNYNEGFSLPVWLNLFFTIPIKITFNLLFVLIFFPVLKFVDLKTLEKKGVY